MKNKPTTKKKQFSRRGILPLLGSTLLLPFLGLGNPLSNELKGFDNDDQDAYKILLRPDGTTVKVKTNTLKQANLVKKNISNNSFLNWLGKDSDSK